MNKSATNYDVARWLELKIDADGYVSREQAIVDVVARFGDSFVRVTQSGGQAFTPGLVQAFKKLTSSTVIYDRSSATWRKRADYDAPGRRQG